MSGNVSNIGPNLSASVIQQNDQNIDNDLQNTKANVNAVSIAFQAADAAHAASTTAHDASAITFAPGSSGLASTKADAAIKEVNTRVTNIIAGPASSAAEVIDARTGADSVARASLGSMVREIHAQLLAANIASAMLQHGLNVVSVNNGATPLNITVGGRTRVNILGKDGGCESLTPFTTSGTVATSTTQVKQGSNSIKLTAAGSSASVFKDYTYPLDTAKTYIVAGWVYIESYTSGTPQIQLCDVGTGTARYTASAVTTTVGSWQFIYAKIPAANTLVGTGFRLYLGMFGSITCTAYYDAIRLYEVSAADYTAIGTTYTTSTAPSIDDIWPYVDSVKHNQGIAITKQGKNLAGTGTDFTLNANAVVTAPYNIILNATGNFNQSTIDVSAVAGQSYTFSAQVTGYISGSVYPYITIQALDVNNTVLGSSANMSPSASGSQQISVTYTLPAGTVKIRAYLNNVGAGTFTFSNWILVLGSTYDGIWEAANPDYVYANVTLAGNVDGTAKDTLIYRDGAWRIDRRWKTDVALDGSLAWTLGGDYTGFKRIRFSNWSNSYPSFGFTGNSGDSLGKLQLVKFDGKITTNYEVNHLWDSADKVSAGSLGNLIDFTISDTDTGFDNAYIPSNTELSGTMNGWKVNGYTAGTTATNEASGSVAASGTYTLTNAGKYKSVTITKSTDNVTFVAATEGTDYTVNFNATNAVLTNNTAGALYYKITYTYGVTPNSWASVVDGSAPATNTLAYVSANKATNYTPYKLTYQLATTVEEVMTSLVEGSIDLNSGGNQIEVSEAVIIREKVKPYAFTSTVYLINSNDYPASNLSNRANKILAVYKNGIRDTTWTIENIAVAYGNQRARLNGTIDPTAEYTVTYLIYANDKGGYTSNVIDVTGDYNTTTKTILDNVNKKLADDETNITILQATAARKGQGQWIAPTMLNAWVNYGGTDAAAAYMKDDFGWVNVKGRIKSGTIGQTAFTLPAGYRPLETQRFAVSSNGAFGELIVNPDGTVVPTVGSNVSFNVQINFRAEQ